MTISIYIFRYYQYSTWSLWLFYTTLFAIVFSILLVLLISPIFSPRFQFVLSNSIVSHLGCIRYQYCNHSEGSCSAYIYSLACIIKNLVFTCHLYGQKMGKNKKRQRQANGKLSNRETEKFIELVRENPTLYDQSKKIYLDRGLKWNIFKKIAKKMDVDGFTGKYRNLIFQQWKCNPSIWILCVIKFPMSKLFL